ncbi:hypothetical protein DITRI_Ditri03aG0139900 [Diplodiscus trichospermus]
MLTTLSSREYRATWRDQLILFKRGLKERRHEYFSCMRVTQVLSTAIIMDLLWWCSDASSPNGLQHQATVCYMLTYWLLFFISVFWAFFPMFTAIFTFPQERVMLAKERSVGMYTVRASMLSGGFFYPESSSISAFVSWLQYMSFTYHTCRLLLKIQYGCLGSDAVSGSCKSPFRGLRVEGWHGSWCCDSNDHRISAPSLCIVKENEANENNCILYPSTVLIRIDVGLVKPI